MKQRILSFLLAGAMALSLAVPALAASELPFTDVKESAWYYEYVKDLYNSEVIDGVTSTTFNPQGTVTVGQALKMILLAAGYEEQPQTTSHWASGYYQFASRQGFLPQGFSLGLDDPITRLQIAQITAAAMKLSRTGSDTPFSDTTDQSALILYDHGIFEGLRVSGNLVFKPQADITRAEMSTVTWRILQYEATAAPEEPDSTTEPDTDTDTDVDTDVDTDDDTDTDTDTDPDAPSFTFYGKKVYIKSDVATRQYDSSLFSYNSDGFLTYTGSDYDYKIGVDVSRYQKDIDWAAVKAAGVDFAMIRVGYRGYGSAGTLVKDVYFKKNIEGALANGIEVGVYFFSQAISTKEAIAEAQYTLDLIQGYDITYPVVFDWEPYSSSVGARTDGLSDKVLTKCAAAFCDTVQAAGYTPMVYANLTYFYLHYNLSALKDYPLWLAQYTSKPTFYYHFEMWQYGSKGQVDGIDGNVDVNLYFIPK